MNVSTHNAQPAAATEQDPCWASVVARDPKLLGHNHRRVLSSFVRGSAGAAGKCPVSHDA